MSKKVGKDCKVTLGSNTIIGMGNWKLDGISVEQFESSEFQDNWKEYMFGQKDGGQISFGGHYDPADADGQQYLQYANLANIVVTDLRLYVDNTSYFEPCQTTGYFSPTTTENADTKPSWVNITAYHVESDKGGLMATDFEAKVSGVMVLV